MYNTGNAVPSSALEDMADNAQTFDALVTKTEGTTTDRLGRTRRVFQQILMDMGFQPLAGSFQTGATITARNQVLYDEVSHVFYSWGGAIPGGGYIVPAGSTPATSGGIGAGAWVDRTDVTLRSELVASDGYKLIGSCASISALRSAEPSTNGQQINVTGYYTSNDGAGGVFWYDSTDTTSTDDGGAVIVTTGGKRWKRVGAAAEVTTKQFGCKADDSTNDSSALQKFFSYIGSSGAVGIISAGRHKITSGLTCTSTKPIQIKSEPGAVIWVYAAVQALTITTTRPCSVHGLTVNPRVNGASGILFNDIGILVTRGIDVSSPNTTDSTGFVTGLHYHNCSYTKTYDFWDMATSGNAFIISSNGKSSVSHDVFAPNVFGANTGLIVDISGAVGAGVEGLRVFGGELVTNNYGVYITNSTPYTPPLFKFSSCHISSNVCVHADHVTHVVLSAVNLYCKIKWLALVSCGENSIVGGEFVCIGAGGVNPISLESTTSIDITGVYSSYPTSHHMMALYNTPTEVRLRSSTYNVNNWSKNVSNGDVFAAGVAPAPNSIFRDNFPQCPKDSTYDYAISSNSVNLTDRGDVYRIIHTGTINNFAGYRNRAVTIALLSGVTLTHGSGLSIIGYANYTTTAAATYCVFIPNQDGTGWIEISRRT